MPIIANIGADVSDYLRGMEQIVRSNEGVVSSVKDLATKFLALLAIKEVAGAVKEFVEAGFEAIDTTAKMARGLGATYDSMRAVQIAADYAGVSTDEFGQAAQRLNVTLGKAQAGSTEASSAFRTLGLDAGKLAALDVNERFAAIADRVRELGLSTSSTAAVLRDMGIKNAALVDILRQGGDQFRDAAQQVKDYGLSLSAVDTAQVEAANDALTKAKLTLEGARNQIVVALAPVVKALADKFADLAKENGGWGNIAKEAIDKVISGIGFLADVIRGLEVVWIGMKLVGQAAFAAIISVIEIAFEAAVAFPDALIETMNKVAAIARALGFQVQNLPTFAGSQFAKDLHDFGESSRQTVVDTENELHNLAMQDMPSGKIRQFYTEITLAAQAAAEASNKALAPRGGVELQDSGETDKQNAELQKLIDQTAAKYKIIADGNLSEQDQLLQKYVDQQKIVDNAFNLGLISEEDRQKQLLALKLKYIEASNQAELAGLTASEKFNRMSWQGKLKTTIGTLAEITSGVTAQSKEVFEIQKAAALAQAIAVLPSAVIESYNNSGGFPWGIPSAVAMAAIGAANIAAIASSHFNGKSGSSSASAAGSGGAAAAGGQGGGGGIGQGGAAQPAGGTLVLQGVQPSSLFSGTMVRELVDRISEFQRDGGKVVFG